MSGWNHGCGKVLELYSRRGRAYLAPCGSTSESGGVNQCEDCERHLGAPPDALEDEGDLEYDNRVYGGV